MDLDPRGTVPEHMPTCTFETILTIIIGSSLQFERLPNINLMRM